MEIAENIGIKIKGKYQIAIAKAAPIMGLKTFPNVFDVSIKPSPVLTSSSSLNKSPTVGITTGNAPDAPTPL